MRLFQRDGFSNKVEDGDQGGDKKKLQPQEHAHLN